MTNSNGNPFHHNVLPFEEQCVSEHFAKAFEILVQRGYTFKDVVEGFAAIPDREFLLEDGSVYCRSPWGIAEIMQEWLARQGRGNDHIATPGEADAAFWAGYLLCQWYFAENTRPSDALRIASARRLQDVYGMLHTQSIRYAINVLKEEPGWD